MHTTTIARPTMYSLHLSASERDRLPPRWLNLANARSARFWRSEVTITWIDGATETFIGEQAQELTQALAELP